MMQFGGGAASMHTPVQPGLIVRNHQLCCTYRDSIRRASVPGGHLCRPPVRFFPASAGDTASAGEDAYYYCWSSASSASSPAYSPSSSGRCSPVSLLSFSSDSDLSFSACCLHGVEELRSIALQMVRDGYTNGLIRSFSAAGEDLLLGSWFAELDVEWVLLLTTREEGDKKAPRHVDLDDGCAVLLDLMERWIKGLKSMVQVLSITQRELTSKKPTTIVGVRKAISYFVLLATGKMAEREQEVLARRFVRFAEASILRMLDFVDTVAAAVALNDDLTAAETLPGMLQVYTCVVDDSPTVLALFKEASGGAASASDAMNDVFLRKRSKLSDAIWSMMDKVRASFLTDDCWRVSPAAGEAAGDVHETTRLMMNYVKLLWRNEGALNLVLHDQHHRFGMFLSDPEDHCSSSVAHLIEKMVSCSEKQLEKASNFIADPGLRYIFLMNNFSFISEKVSSLLLPPFEATDYKIERFRGPRERLQPMEDWVNHPDRSIGREIEMDSNLDGLVKTQSFMEAYLDASWEPVMSCLYHDIPRGFLKWGGALEKFESEFRRTWAVQRTWKIPNPELRKRLRKAVTEKVMSGCNQYLTERMARGKSSRPTTSTTLLELEELLEELFEG
ncbi:hypothetical protein HU200_035725 [Digitaria exilis]|uniref:Exocyst subunit Exo70 family protein n=1 Tax=Digitaria exilis TaxID=1010633 RepID=A0A835ELX0_9POAL|nr:hypothetical protein HU200_035725 [Digitaria exilis]